LRIVRAVAARTKRPILVVDDDPDLCALVRRVLEHDGYRVVAFSDPREALAASEREHPSLVFADLMLPQMDGETLIGELRARLPEPPAIVIVSASAARASIAKKLGVDASLAKPFELDDLRDLAARFALADRRSSMPAP
jgi:CheY-like chemotaxis protein